MPAPDPTTGRAPRVAIGAVAVIALGAALALLTGTRPRGPGLTIDSTSYLGGAEHYTDRNLLNLVLNDVFPPGYPFAIGVAGTVTDGLLDAARGVNIAALVATIALVALATWTAAPERPGRHRAAATVLGAVFVAVSSGMLRWSSYVMSESLSIAFVMASVAAAVPAARHRSPRWAIAAGAAGGCAALVRHVALGTLGGVAVAIFLAGRGRWRERGTPALTTLVAGGVTWFGGTRLLVGAVESERAVSWHPPDLADVRQGLGSLGSYWLPDALGLTAIRWITLLTGIALVAATGWLLLRWRGAPAVTVIAATVALAHAVAVIGSMAWLDDLTPADDRILLPLLPLVVLTLSSAWAAATTTRAMNAGLAVVLAIVFVGQVDRSEEWWHESRDFGLGYAHSLFDDSGVLAEVRAFPEGTEVWANDISLVYLRGGVSAFQLPSRIDGYAGRDNPHFDEQMEELRRHVEDGAVVVVVNYFDFSQLPNADELEAYLGDVERTDFPEGSILRAAPAP